MRDMIHSYTIWLINVYCVLSFLPHWWHDSFIYVMWLIYMREVALSYTQWLINMYCRSFCTTLHIIDVPHSYAARIWMRAVDQTYKLVTHKRVTSRKWVISYIRLSHVTYVNESCLPYERVVPHTGLNHVTQVKTYERDMSHIWTRHVKCMTESCHTCHTHQNAMPRMSMHHATHLNACEWHDSFTREACICVTWLNHMCDMTHVRKWDSFMCDLFICVIYFGHTHTHTHTHVNTSYHTCLTPVNRVIHQKWAASRFGIQFKTSKRYRLAKRSQSSAQQSFQMANWVTNWSLKKMFTKALHLDIQKNVPKRG